MACKWWSSEGTIEADYNKRFRAATDARERLMSGDWMTSKYIFLRGWKRVSCVLSLLIIMVATLIAQQRGSQSGPPPPYTGESPAQRAEDVWTAQQHKIMEKKANVQRQQDIRKDTEKLLELATELKQEV